MDAARSIFEARKHMPDAPFQRKIYEALWAPGIKSVLERIPLLRRIYSGWTRTHPFDAEHAVHTSGFVPAAECAGDSGLADQIIAYAGSQPSIVRAALAALPEPERFTFVDIGCGMGRPLMVASEFPFKRLLGIELAPGLAEIARHNAARIALRHPDRPPIAIEVGDATTAVSAPADRVVYFMYNAFNLKLVQALIRNIERQLLRGLQHVFFVYYNPVHGEVLDQSPHFARWAAQTIPYASGELGYGPDIEDTVVIWQSWPEHYAPHRGAARRIAVSPAQWCSLATA